MTEEDFNTALDKAIPPSVPPVEPLMQFFDYDDAPWAIKGILGEAFLTMALAIARNCPRNAESTIALRKLLEARDCAMRAAVMK